MQIYLTTNKINGKKYIGRELHNNPNYLGSGKTFKKAIKKYNRSYCIIKDTLLKNNICIGNKKVNRRIIE